MQLEQPIGCFYEMETGQKSLRGLQWIEAIIDFWIGEFLFFVLLAVSINIGDATIPSYLGDEYSYDNFDRKEGDESEYNYWLQCYIDNDGEILKYFF